MISNRVLSLGLVLVLLMGLLPASPMSAVTYALAEEVETSQKAEDSPEGDSSDEHEPPSKPAESVAPEQSQAPAFEESPDESTGDKPDPSTDDEDHFNPSGNIEANLQELSDISEGYAVVLTDKSPILKKAKKGSDRIAFLSKKDIVYVSNRIFKDADNPGNDWVSCHFDSKRGVIDGYMRLRRLRFLTGKETKKFLIKFADSDEYSVYDGHPLARIECNFTAAFEPGSEPLPVADLRPSAASEQEMVSTPEPESSQAHDPVAALGLEGSADLTQSLQPEEPTQSIDAAPVPVQLETVPDRPGAEADSQSGVAAGEGESGIANLTSPAAIVDEYSVVTLSDAPLVESILLHMYSPYVRVGDSVEVSVQVNPADAGQELVWTSNKTDIATVTDGIVTGLAPGRATITATATDGSRVKGTLVVSVYRPVTSITFNQSSGSLLIGKTLKLSATVAPQDATYKTIVWESSDPAVATVSDKGLVTAIGSGEAVITARTDFGATGSESATFVLTVAPAVESIVLSAAQSTLRIGDSVLVTAEVTPADAGQELVWTSNKTDIATVTDGIVTGVAPGRVTITATATDGSRVKGTLVVSVYRPVTSIALNESSGSMLIGKTLKLTATVAPEDATYKTIVWESSDLAVATVSDKGLVTAIGSGEAVITARTDFGATGSESATFVLTVASAVESIVLSAAQSTLRIGDSVAVTAEVNPADAGQGLVWTSNKTDIATVTDGTVTGVAPGRATITATATDGSKVKGTLVVSVYRPVTSITLNQSSGSLLVGKTLKLSATVAPEDATYKTIVWESSNPSVATVSDKGLVTAIGSGEAVITARTDFGATGSESATFVLTVSILTANISLSMNPPLLREGGIAAISAAVLPDGASQVLIWSSSDAGIATVVDGAVTGVAPGSTTITATATDGSGISGTLTISVYRPVTSIALDQPLGSLKVGETLTLTALIQPEDATYKAIRWESSDPNVAAVDINGVVTAVSVGDVTLTANTDYGAIGDESAECALTVIDQGQGTNDFTYAITDNEVAITGYTGAGGNITIPASIGGLPVKAIADHAFGWNANITSVVVPDGLNVIGTYVFENCFNITSITLPDSVTSIGRDAFGGCYALKSMDLPDGITRIEHATFNQCHRLESVSIPAGVTFIGDQAFNYCTSLNGVILPEGITSIEAEMFRGDAMLESIEIPEGVTSIGDYAFDGCSALASAYIPASVTSISNSAFGGCSILMIYGDPDSYAQTYAEDHGIPFMNQHESVTDFTYVISDGKVTITGYTGAGGTVAIPVTIDGLPVKSIGYAAFEYQNEIASLVIPGSVNSIGGEAFRYCANLASISIPNSVIIIGDGALYGCGNLANIDLPDGITEIGNETFAQCSMLNNIIIPNGVTSIGSGSFKECISLTNLMIPSSVTVIGENAFLDCSALASVYIPVSVTSIGDNAFLNCSSLTIYGYIGSAAEAYADANDIPFVEHGADIAHFTYAVSGSVLAITGYTGSGGAITIPASIGGLPVKAIADHAFGWNANITSVEVPDGVNAIGSYAFENCFNITSITLPDSVMSIGRDAFGGCYALKSMDLPDGITRIEHATFNQCIGLENVSIPAGVTFIGDQAFNHCYSLSGVILPEGITSIEAEMFRGDAMLESIEIPEGVTSIGDYAFDGCSALTSAYIPASVTSISDSAFGGCSALTIYSYPGSTAEAYASDHGIPFIVRMSFTYTISNDEVTITGYVDMGGDIVIPPTIEGFPVRTIANSVFEGNCDISSVTVLAEVRSIGERVFADCSSISAIELPDSVTLIGPEAFSGCTQLVRMNLPENLTRIERGMFSLCRDLEKVSIPTGVTFIGEQAFSDCEELRRIGLPEGVIYIEAETFRGDWRLGSIVFPDGVTGIGNGAFDSCGSLDSAYIPTSVQLIGESSFSGCDNLTIYGYAGSFAQSYASEHSIPFVDRTGQVAFSQPRYYETDGVIFIVVRTADFNADGDLDFAAICYHNDEPGDPNKVIVFLGNGDGTFDAAHTYIVGTTPIGLKIADFNKDGNADLAVACMWSNTIAILLGNGDGSFNGPMNFEARQFPSDIVITDFDGDGNLDIATPNSWMECVSILKGDGQGNFTLTDTTYEAGGSSSQMMDTADLNNDGLMDIVVVNAYSPGIGILFGNGDGSFQSPEVLTTHDHPFDAKVGDINHDGVLDIVVTNEESRDLSVLIGNGDGTFQSAVQYPTNSGRIELTDLNSDGNVDVAISALYGDYASILLGNGDGTFQNAFTIPTANYWCQGVASGDFNGDGKIDLVLAQEDNVCVLLNK